MTACGDPGCKALENYAFGVNLVDPVDVYVQANRAVKYALLFVLLTFAGFFLFEIMRDLRIHPVQYGLVGLALAIRFAHQRTPERARQLFYGSLVYLPVLWVLMLANRGI